MNLVDTSGWLEYFFDGVNAAFFAPVIEDTENLIVSVINEYEVYKKVLQIANKQKALRSVAQMKLGKIIPLSEDIALFAAEISIQYKIPMADSIIYATGMLNNANVWTQDVDFKNLPRVKYIKKG